MLAREGEAKGSYPLREGEGVPRRRERRRQTHTDRRTDGRTGRNKLRETRGLSAPACTPHPSTITSTEAPSDRETAAALRGCVLVCTHVSCRIRFRSRLVYALDLVGRVVFSVV